MLASLCSSHCELKESLPTAPEFSNVDGLPARYEDWWDIPGTIGNVVSLGYLPIMP